MANLTNKYIWLIGVLNTAGERGLTLSEIDDKWRRERYGLNEFGEPLARQTFCRWRDGITTTFGLEIRCHRSSGFRHYISNFGLDRIERLKVTDDTYIRCKYNSFTVSKNCTVAICDSKENLYYLCVCC